MNGTEVKEKIKSAGFFCWQVASEWGITDGNFSRKLRKPFTDEEVSKLNDILAKLKKEREEQAV
ncbi:MAG: hypothetical protein IJF18_00060 [Oscillospiraceae bacterium]|nr:hypothetical protein [Oscillospiraceae bacterium]